MKPMYLDYFGLADAPFSIAPDPRYLYMSPAHREALAHLLYGVKSDNGFVVLTGEVGAGKTTVCRCLLEQLPVNCDVALIFNPRLSVIELLATVCEEFGIAVPEAHPPGVKSYVDRINAWLLETHAKGRMAVLIVDEAQSFAADVLEQLRLLTNLETNERKLLRMVLLGQPQLRDILNRPDMAQLTQRIVARYHLGTLSRQDMGAYLAHRLTVSGARRELFSPSALTRLHRLSQGIPRLVNIIADRALLGAYVRGNEQVDGATVERAAKEVTGKGTIDGSLSLKRAVSGIGLGAACVAAVLAAYVHYRPSSTVGPAVPPAREAAIRPISPVTLVAAEPSAQLEKAALEPPSPVGEGGSVSAAEGGPPDEVLRQGHRGPDVERLRKDLALLRGLPEEERPNSLYDLELALEVQGFQAAEGLPADGVVGPQTRLRLNQAVGLARRKMADRRKGG